MLDENNPAPQQQDTMPQTLKSHSFNTFTSPFSTQPLYQPSDYNKRMDNPSIRKGLDAITTSLNQLGDTFEKAFEVNLSVKEKQWWRVRQQT